ncbi:MAG: multicopper oxidase domain-containing protein [Pseudomonadota bacterium]|nr:multicopper oxidase domain-containing protein [Pseudomonadota bacterium]
MPTRRLSAAVGCSLLAGFAVAGCDYVGLLRPNVLAQLDPEMVALMNELPNLDEPNEMLVGRLFATGGLSRAELGEDGVMRDRVRVPRDELLWYPAIIVMPRSGTLELDVTNEDHRNHAVNIQSVGSRQLLRLPPATRGLVRIQLDNPGMYWFGCPVENHATRGMLGFVFVRGEVPPEARLDRPRQPQAGDRRPPRAHRHD